MNYFKLYKNLIENAKFRETNNLNVLGEYYETHHIVPRSLGGSNDKTNLVALTAKEHYIAHHLLYHLYKNNTNYGFNSKMLQAWVCMCYVDNNGKRYKISSRTFNYVRKLCSDAKRDMNIYNFVHKSGKKFSGTRLDLIIHTNGKINKDTINTIVTIKKVSVDWCLVGYEPNDFYWKHYELEHLSGKIVSGFYIDIKNEINITEYEIDLLARTIQPQIRGWRVLKVDNKDIIQQYEKNCLNNKPYEPNPTICTWKNKNTDAIENCTMKDLTEKYQLRRTDVSAVFYGRLRSVKGWELITRDGVSFVYSTPDNQFTKTKISNSIIREWYHSEYGTIYDTIPNISSRYNISRHYLNLIITGKQKSTHGWVYKGVYNT